VAACSPILDGEVSFGGDPILSPNGPLVRVFETQEERAQPMKYMRGPNGKVKPVLDIYVEQAVEEGFVELVGQELKDYEMEQAYFAALRVKDRYREGAVQSRPLTKAEQAAIDAWAKRAEELKAERAAAKATVGAGK